MSTSPHESIPPLTLGWRLKMALSHGGMTRDQMAHELGVTPSTISRWMGDSGSPPARAYVAQWAMLTGVDRAWLETGKAPTRPGPNGGESSPSDLVARLAASKRRGAKVTGEYLAGSAAA